MIDCTTNQLLSKVETVHQIRSLDLTIGREATLYRLTNDARYLTQPIHQNKHPLFTRLQVKVGHHLGSMLCLRKFKNKLFCTQIQVSKIRESDEDIISNCLKYHPSSDARVRQHQCSTIRWLLLNLVLLFVFPYISYINRRTCTLHKLFVSSCNQSYKHDVIVT